MRTGPVVVLLLGSLAASLSAAPPRRVVAAEWPVTVVTVAGVGDTLRKGRTTWARAELRDEVFEGDAVRTAAATRLSLRTVTGHTLRMGPGTRLVLLADGTTAGDRAPRVRMTGGWLWVAALPVAGARSQLDIEVGPAMVGVLRGGVAVRVNRDGSVMVRTHHGGAVVSGPGDRREWERPMSERQEVLVPIGAAPALSRPLAPDEFEAEWVKWNEDQDLAGGYGGRAASR